MPFWELKADLTQLIFMYVSYLCICMGKDLWRTVIKKFKWHDELCAYEDKEN